MLKFTLTTLLLILSFNSVTLASDEVLQSEQNSEYRSKKHEHLDTIVYGANLFSGVYKQPSFSGFNPNYTISVGDIINVKIWGAFSYEEKIAVDSQGNIFLPSIGPIKVIGQTNANLNDFILLQARKVYENNVFIYANLDSAQPVKVFVTGSVMNPGLYGGLSSDSILSYLDLANGINPISGSFIDISVIRAGKTRAHFNLYDFLLEGKMPFVQLVDGDVIFVSPRKSFVKVDGDVANIAEFEFKDSITAEQALKLAQPKPSATHFSITRETGNAKQNMHYAISESKNITLHNGDKIVITSEKSSGSILIKVDKSHDGTESFALSYGSTLNDVMEQLKPNKMLEMTQVQIFRKSVAKKQKETIDANLSKLEAMAYTAQSSTVGAVDIRTKEAELISRFVEKARMIEPRGQVVLGEKYNPKEVILEDGDLVFIPSKTSVILVQGEVNFPTAMMYSKGSNYKDYIKKAGGFNIGSDKNNVLVLKPSGSIYAASDVGSNIKPGDEILVLPKINTKSVETASAITKVLYQIAVSSKIILGF